MVPKFLNLNKPWSCKYSRLRLPRTLCNSNLPLTRSNFHFPSDHFLYNFTLDNSNFFLFPLKVRIVGRRLYGREKTGMTFLCMIAFRNKMVAHTFLLSFDNANDHLCSERDPDILLPWLRDVTILSIGQAVPSKACENN